MTMTELIVQTAHRLLAEVDELVSVSGVSEADAFAIVWQELADHCPEMADAVADAVGWTPPDVTRTALTPETIFEADGHWYHDGREITDEPLWWRCEYGHAWQETLRVRTTPGDPGCPDCTTAS